MKGTTPYYITAVKIHTSHSFYPVTRMEHLRNKAAAQNFRDLPKKNKCVLSCGLHHAIPQWAEMMIHGYESPVTSVTLGLWSCYGLILRLTSCFYVPVCRLCMCVTAHVHTHAHSLSHHYKLRSSTLLNLTSLEMKKKKKHVKGIWVLRFDCLSYLYRKELLTKPDSWAILWSSTEWDSR